MKRPVSFYFFCLLFSVICLLTSVLYAAVPHLLNYQGRLTDSSAKPLEGSYNLTFRIYDSETAGNLKSQVFERQGGVSIFVMPRPSPIAYNLYSV